VVSKHSTDTVTVGSNVTIKKKGKDSTQTYTIVGSEEADTNEGKVSVKSPIGDALFGQEKGETVKVETPGGEKEFTIVDIQ